VKICAVVDQGQERKKGKERSRAVKMLAIFSQTVAKSPEGLKSPEGHMGAVSGVGPVMQLFSSSHEGSVTVSLGSPGAIAYDSSNKNPFLPR
jgi:Aluminium induced protein